MGTILSGLMTIGVTTPSRAEAAGAGWASPPSVYILYLCTILYIPGLGHLCIIVQVGAGKWGRASNNHLGLGTLFIGSVRSEDRRQR